MCIIKLKEPIYKGNKLYNSKFVTFWKNQNYETIKMFVVARGFGKGGMNRWSTEDF